MTAPKRIVVVDDDAKVRQLIERALRPPEFEFHGFSDGRDALMKLHEIRPDLIISDVMMPDMDGRIFLQVVKRARDLKDVPFIFLSAVRAGADVQTALDSGAESFLVKPFPVSRLVEKVRETLARPPEPPSRPAALLTPPVPMPAPVPLPEGGRSETPVIAESLTIHPADPPAPEGAEDTASPGVAPLPAPFSEASKDDFFDMLLSTDNPATKPGLIIPGRISVLEVSGKHVQVLTEAECRPNFVVSTVVAREGQGLRKIETSWRHPLLRREDVDFARRQIDIQHGHALASIEDLVVEAAPRSALWGARGRTVDGSLLAWALSRVAEEARSRIGSASTVDALERTHHRLARARAALRSFRVVGGGRVIADPTRGSRVAEPAVEDVATWTRAFLVETGGPTQVPPGQLVRHVTRMRHEELERAGFYGALDSAGLVRPRGPAPPAPGAYSTR